MTVMNNFDFVSGAVNRINTAGAGGGLGGGIMNALSNANHPYQAVEAIGSGLFNRGIAAAGPMASTGLGMMGLDPMSMMMKAGMSSFGRMGIGGMAGMMGVAGAGASILGTGVQYGIGQMAAGAQEQQHLNNTLRSSFNFMNNNGYNGFNSSSSQHIGSFMRGMTHEVGERGEMHSMGELTNLAGNMGKMGMADTVRSVGDFKKKFSEMVSNLKKIATDMGSSLEEAQKFTGSVRQMGVFDGKGQVAMAGAVRHTAIAGNMSSEEVMRSAMMGSQISRSIGGLGRSGAVAGMRTIGQVGTAIQVGALSEDDIYNATGLTGEDGRAAFAANSMASSARFLKSSKGRYMIASMAGKDGHLDEESVEKWLSGDVSVGDTKGMAGKNLSKVGRANFIRNEGRLRGEVLGRFGGLTNVMALSQWASGKGIDINNMDDRSMLFAQRYLGMDREQLDATVAMHNKLPEILEAQKRSAADVGYNDKVASIRANSGAVGAVKKVEHLKEKMNNAIKEMGSDLYNSALNVIDRISNEMSDTYYTHITEGVREVYHAMKAGGEGGRSAFKNFTGGLKFSGGGSAGGMSAGQADYAKQAMLGAAGVGLSGDNAKIAASFKNDEGSNKLHNIYTHGNTSAVDRALAATPHLAAMKILDEAGVKNAFSMSPQQAMALRAQMEKDAGIHENLRVKGPMESVGNRTDYRTEEDYFAAKGKALSGNSHLLDAAFGKEDPSKSSMSYSSVRRSLHKQESTFSKAVNWVNKNILGASSNLGSVAAIYGSKSSVGDAYLGRMSEQYGSEFLSIAGGDKGAFTAMSKKIQGMHDGQEKAALGMLMGNAELARHWEESSQGGNTAKDAKKFDMEAETTMYWKSRGLSGGALDIAVANSRKNGYSDIKGVIGDIQDQRNKKINERRVELATMYATEGAKELADFEAHGAKVSERGFVRGLGVEKNEAWEKEMSGLSSSARGAFELIATSAYKKSRLTGDDVHKGLDIQDGINAKLNAAGDDVLKEMSKTHLTGADQAKYVLSARKQLSSLTNRRGKGGRTGALIDMAGYGDYYDDDQRKSGKTMSDADIQSLVSKRLEGTDVSASQKESEVKRVTNLLRSKGTEALSGNLGMDSDVKKKLAQKDLDAKDPRGAAMEKLTGEMAGYLKNIATSGIKISNIKEIRDKPPEDK